MAVEIQDYSIQVKDALNSGAITGLYLAAVEIQKAVVDNSRIDTGQLKGSWNHHVDESALEATIGSPLENAIWEEFGTGEYAAEGNGRKGGWFYENKNGETVFTRGKYPTHALQKAFDSKKGVAERLIKQSIQEAAK